MHRFMNADDPKKKRILLFSVLGIAVFVLVMILVIAFGSSKKPSDTEGPATGNEIDGSGDEGPADQMTEAEGAPDTSESEEEESLDASGTIEVIDGPEEETDFTLPDMVIKQSSDSDSVSVQTDGKVDITELTDYLEGSSPDKEISDSRITIASIGSYSGPFVEDGSDDPVSDVLSIVLTNTSEEFLQYSIITLTDGSHEAVFEVSNLPAGASALVLEKNRTPSNGQWTFVNDLSSFISEASLHEELFSWQAGDNFLAITGIGSETLSQVWVYYKNTENSIYVGGITYRIAFEGLEPGATMQKLSRHFKGDNSHVMMIDYIN